MQIDQISLCETVRKQLS